MSFFRKVLGDALAIAVVILVFTLSAYASGKIYYGSRAGMTVTVKSMSDLDSSHAKITTEHTRDDAVGFCRDYVQEDPVTEKCILQELSVRLNDVITADCLRGVYSPTSTAKSTNSEEENPRSKEFWAKYLLINLRAHEVADGSSASGYDVNMHIFRALCPRTAPPAD